MKEERVGQRGVETRYENEQHQRLATLFLCSTRRTPCLATHVEQQGPCCTENVKVWQRVSPCFMKERDTGQVLVTVPVPHTFSNQTACRVQLPQGDLLSVLALATLFTLSFGKALKMTA